MMHLVKAFAATLLIAASLVAPLGCSATGGSSVDGTSWRLTGWSVSSLSPTDFDITANFANGQISGNSGVNTYSGPCTLGPGEAFAAGPLAGTMMAGPEPAMRAEGAYLTLLDQAASYKMADGRLTLYDEGGNESLSFEVASK